GVRAEVDMLHKDHNLIPRLDVVLVGKSPASQRYVGKKMEACRNLGMQAELHIFDDHVSARKLVEQVQGLSDNPDVHAILVQLPLPRHIEEPRDVKETHDRLNNFDVFDAIKG